MRIAVLTLWADNYDEVAAITVPIMEQYCLKHNYSFNPIKIEVLKDNSYGFEKIKQAQKIINDFDAILIIDPDALITNHTIKIDSFIDDKHSLFISKDINGFNAGVFITKGQLILNKILVAGKYFDNEQDTITYLYSPENKIKELTFPNNLQSIPYKYYAPEYGYINPDSTPTEPTEEMGNWCYGNFICHVPGRSLEERVKILTQLKEYIVYE